MSHAQSNNHKKLMGFYNAAKWSMDGVCYLDVYADNVAPEEEESLKRHLEDLGITFDVSKKGTIKGFFEGTYDRVFPVMRQLLEEGWSW